MALASGGTGTKRSPGPSSGPSPGLLAVASGAWGGNHHRPSLEQSSPRASSLKPGTSPVSDASRGLALVSDPLGLGLPPGGIVLGRVQGCAASAGLAQVLLRMLDHSAGTTTKANTSTSNNNHPSPSQTSQSNRTAPLNPSQSNVVSGLLQRQRLLVWTAIESFVAVSAHPCPRLLLQVGELVG